MGVVAALAAEARALGPAVRPIGGVSQLRSGSLLAVSGMGPTRAEMSALRLVEAGASALMSFGMAGGLDPALPAGAMVLPRDVMSRDGKSFPTATEWRERLTIAVRGLGPVHEGKLLCDARAIHAIAAKAAAFRDTGAVAVDMESLAIAQVAAAHRLPFVAVRVIVDTAADELPRAVVMATQEGHVQIWRLLGAIALAPMELGGLVRLAGRYRTATRRLAAVAQAALPARAERQARAA